MYQAIGNRVVVKKIIPEEKTASGIILSEELSTQLDKTAKAVVVSVGSGKREDGTIEPMPVEIGDTILYHRHYGTDISGMIPTDDDRDLMVLAVEDILAVVDGGES